MDQHILLLFHLSSLFSWLSPRNITLLSALIWFKSWLESSKNLMEPNPKYIFKSVRSFFYEPDSLRVATFWAFSFLLITYFHFWFCFSSRKVLIMDCWLIGQIPELELEDVHFFITPEVINDLCDASLSSLVGFSLKLMFIHLYCRTFIDRSSRGKLHYFTRCILLLSYIGCYIIVPWHA